MPSCRSPVAMASRESPNPRRPALAWFQPCHRGRCQPGVSIRWRDGVHGRNFVWFLLPGETLPGARYVSGRTAVVLHLPPAVRCRRINSRDSPGGRRGGDMGLAMRIRPAPSAGPGPDAASNAMCQGGHHAARSITRTFTEMD
jgi:hypothetical protein